MQVGGTARSQGATQTIECEYLCIFDTWLCSRSSEMVCMTRDEVFDPNEVVVAHVCNRTVCRCILKVDDAVWREQEGLLIFADRCKRAPR